MVYWSLYISFINVTSGIIYGKNIVLLLIFFLSSRWHTVYLLLCFKSLFGKVSLTSFLSAAPFFSGLSWQLLSWGLFDGCPLLPCLKGTPFCPLSLCPTSCIFNSPEVTEVVCSLLLTSLGLQWTTACPCHFAQVQAHGPVGQMRLRYAYFPSTPCQLIPMSSPIRNIWECCPMYIMLPQ